MCKSSWFMLGLGLGIKPDILMRIESERTGNSVENCLFDLLVFWLNSGNASVKNLIDASVMKVHMRVLADKIQKKYAGMV
ncbi:MAG: death domain-containing protein [Proteobacteria bacterium]|nr:death domain-containing protein [Pseudomonadota bacterium]